MSETIFDQKAKEITLKDYRIFSRNSRSNLGTEIPLPIYRMLLYSIREELITEFGKDKMVTLLRKAGFRSGQIFAENLLDITLDCNAFFAELHEKLATYRIGILRVEKYDKTKGNLILTIAEDVDCSGMPLLGETVCNYDEGFLAGILSQYTQKTYQVTEIDCWATGDRVCRFHAELPSHQEL